jgi:large subunit ribosomal protein L31
MKPEIHPEYQNVVFMDSSVTPPYRVLTRSTRTSEESIEMDDGKSYPLIRVDISSASHPFYTGKMKLVDTAGMIDKYRQRYGLKGDEEEVSVEESSAQADETPDQADEIPGQPVGDTSTEAVSSDS